MPIGRSSSLAFHDPKCREKSESNYNKEDVTVCKEGGMGIYSDETIPASVTAKGDGLEKEEKQTQKEASLAFRGRWESDGVK